jgi:hypothetical protein
MPHLKTSKALRHEQEGRGQPQRYGDVCALQIHSAGVYEGMTHDEKYQLV